MSTEAAGGEYPEHAKLRALKAEYRFEEIHAFLEWLRANRMRVCAPGGYRDARYEPVWNPLERYAASLGYDAAALSAEKDLMVERAAAATRAAEGS